MSATQVRQEEFKPIAIARGTGLFSRLVYAVRQAIDFQLLTCLRFLAPHLAGARGRVLDVGCGQMPYRYLLPADAHYTGLDIPAASEFGMTPSPDIVHFDGKVIPFADDSFDTLMCIEVIEHAEDPEGLVSEMFRVLRPGGALVLTVPFSARLHHIPYDFHRFTSYRLPRIFERFETVEIVERGNDICAIANKMIVILMRIARPAKILLWPLGLLLAPFVAIWAIAAHLSLLLGTGSRLDPLGYGVVARKGNVT